MLIYPHRSASRIGRVLLAIVAATALALATAATPASALWRDKICTGYAGCASSGHGNAGYDTAAGSYWGMYAGHNCTNYVAYREIQNGAPADLGYGLGNATDWGTEAGKHGVTVDKTPAVGSVAWFSKASGIGAYGHVAYVEAIEGNTVVVSEDNYGRDFDWSKYNTSDVTGFIHFADAPSVAPSPSTTPTQPSTSVVITARTPKITGKAKVGKLLTGKPGKWKPAGVSFTYQWLRNGASIPGATNATYKIAKADKRKKLSVTVTGTLSGAKSVAKTSARTAKVK